MATTGLPDTQTRPEAGPGLTPGPLPPAATDLGKPSPTRYMLQKHHVRGWSFRTG